MKKILKVFLYLAAFVLLIFGIWLGVNLWPEKKMEAPLWTPAELALPEDPGGNGYRLLVEMRSKPLPSDENAPGSREVSWLLNKVGVYNWPSMSRERVVFFWEEAKFIAPALSSKFAQSQAELQEYKKLIDSPSFVNTDSPLGTLPPQEMERQRSILGSLHGLMAESALQDILQGNVANAYDTWVKLFRMDQGLYFSATSLSTSSLRGLDFDLNLFSLLRMVPPPDGGEKYLQALRDFDPEKFDFRRPLITEYLRELEAADAVAAKKDEGKSFFFRAGFHRAQFQKEANDFFRRLESLVKKDPKGVDATSLKPFREELRNLLRGKFSWVHNPSGKELRSKLSSSWITKYLSAWNDFRSSMEDLQKKKDQLLTGPVFMKAPETQGTESQADKGPGPESQGSESHPSETHPSEPKAPDAAEIQKEAL